MVVAEMPLLDTPALRGNPFDMRPIERSRSHEIVARDEILIEYREHIHSYSPRMKLIVGDHGSGKSSLINVLSSFTDRFYVGQYWHEEEVLRKVLTEILVTFGDYEVPRTMNLTIDKLVEKLESENGPLPLIALDYPSTVPLSEFLSLICPIFQRLRAFIVISLNHSQLNSLDESVIKIFDPPFELKPLKENEIQKLCDKRIMKMANERWKLSTILLESIQKTSGGNVGSIIRILRDIIDEKRGLGCEGTYQRIISWNKPNIISHDDKKNTNQSPYKETISPERKNENIYLESDEEKEEEKDEEKLTKGNDDTPTEFEQYLSQTIKMKNHHNTGSYEEFQNQIEEDEEERILRLNLENADNQKITEWTENDKNLQSDNKKVIPTNTPNKGFSGLMNRSRNASKDMPSGDPENIPVMDSDFPANIDRKKEKIYPIKSGFKNQTSNQYRLDNLPSKIDIDDKSVFSSEGEQWTVDSAFEETLPNITDRTNTFEDGNIEPESIEVSEELQSQIIPINNNQNNHNELDYNHLGNLSEAEELILEIAEHREISPSDPEIQARLEVGRPRLSQLYNSLYKSGILSVRKKGRTRFFKLTENALQHLSGK